MSGSSIKSWFAGLNPDRKRKVVVGGGLAVVLIGIILGVLATDDSGQPKVDTSRRKKIETSILTGKDPQRVGIETLLATNKRQEAQIEALQRQMQVVSNGQSRAAGGGGVGGGLPFPAPNGAQGSEVVSLPGGSPDTVTRPGGGSVMAPAVNPVKAPDAAVDQAINGSSRPGARPGIQAGRGPAIPGANSSELPPPNIPGLPNSDVYGAEQPPESLPVAPPPPPKLKLRILAPRSDQLSDAGDAPGPTSQAIFTNSRAGSRTQTSSLSRGASQRDPEFYLPLASILSGTLMTGVDAPANGAAARKDPFPALLRVKHEAILPNSAMLDLRECFIVSSAYGDLSSERVYMRAEGLSCVRADGAIIEASIDAYASGSDGKAGIRGTVVEKTGQLIARSLVAGFVGGIAKSFKPNQSTAVSVNPATGTTSEFQYPDPSYVVGTSLLSGGAGAADRIAGMYEDLAKQIVPVIEINAGIPVDFIMTRGATLRFKKVGEISGTRAAAVAGGGAARDASSGITTSVSGTSGAPFSIQQGPGSSTPAPAPTGPSRTIPSR